MAGRITNLRFQKRTTERVNVYLEGEYAFALPTVEAAHLRVGQFLTDADITRLQALDLSSKAYDRAIRFLSFRPRSAAEVRRNLAAAEYDEEVIETTLVRLREHGYLDDAEFARFWVEDRQRFRPKGAQALRQELRQRGVDRETIDETLSSLDAADAAYRAAQPKAARLAGLARDDPAAFRRGLAEFLMRRGFEYEVVREVVKRLLQEVAG